MTDDEPLHRISCVPKRAPLTGTSFDFARMEIPCPECKKQSLEPVIELVVNDVIRCRYCGMAIDISSVDCRAKIVEFAEIHKKIKPP